jgi:nucleotide-binding universal stress UspA family protein
MFNWKRILVPVDFSPRSEAALNFAFELARDRDVVVEAVHVTEDPNVAGVEPPYAWMPIRAIIDQAMADIEALRAKHPRLQARVLQGNPAAAIVDEAVRRKADLIVMGTHGRSGLTRLLMGSVAEHVARNAPCPVTLVRLPGEARKETEAVLGAARGAQ